MQAKHADSNAPVPLSTLPSTINSQCIFTTLYDHIQNLTDPPTGGKYTRASVLSSLA